MGRFSHRETRFGGWWNLEVGPGNSSLKSFLKMLALSCKRAVPDVILESVQGLYQLDQSGSHS